MNLKHSLRHADVGLAIVQYKLNERKTYACGMRTNTSQRSDEVSQPCSVANCYII